MTTNNVEDNTGTEGPAESFKDVVLDFIRSINSAGLARQRQLYHTLNKAIASADEVPGPAYEGLIRRTVSFVFNRCQDKDSRQLVESAVRALRARNAPLTLKHLSESVVSHCAISPTFLTKNSNLNAAVVAKWILETMSTLESTSDKPLLHIAVTALGAAAYYAEYEKRGTRIMRKAIQEFARKQQPKLLIDVLKDIAEPQKEVKALCLAAFLAQCTNLTDEDKTALTTFWLDTYGKVALLCQKTPGTHVTNVDRIFEFFTSQSIEQVFIPTAKKALLRSPEIAVHGVRHFLEHVRVSLDDVAGDFFKTTANCTANSDESVRVEGVHSSALVAQKVSKASVLTELVNSAFAQFESNKKAGVGQRLAAGTLIAKLSSNQLEGKEADELTNSVLKRLTPLIANEAHEDTAKSLWNAVEQWSKRASQFPDAGLEVYRKSCAADIRPAIRFVALRVVAAVYENFATVKVDTALLDAVKKVFKTLDNGQSQLPEVVPVVYLLVRASGGSIEKGLRDNIQSINIKEKLITSLDEQGALLISALAEATLPQSSDKYPQAVVQLLAAALFWPSHEVRTRALDAVKKIAASEGLKFRLALIQTMLDDIQGGFLCQAVRKLYETRNPDREWPEKNGVPGWNICFVASAVLHMTGEHDDELLHPQFLASSLLLCSLDNAVHHDGGVWVSWVTKSGHLKSVLKSHEFCDLAVEQLFSDKNTPSRGNAIQLLVTLGDLGHDVSEAIWKRSAEHVRSIDISKYLSVPQASVEIFRTPEGTLYNSAVIEQNSDDAIAAKNIKRESKAYKFKEQLAEIELRKELAEKNRREGKLTERQKKAVDAELKSESKIRKEMRELHAEVEKKLDILCVAARYNPSGATNHIDLLFDTVVPLLKSPLVSKLAANAFFAFRDAFFEPSVDRLHELVAHASLRVLNSAWLDGAWSQEPLEDQLRRAFSSLASMCLVLPEIETDPSAILEMEEDDFVEGITASKLGLLVPMIGEILRNPSYDSKLQDRITMFMKNAIDSQFIKDTELTSLPVIRLMAVLLHTMASPSAVEYLDNVLDALKKYCKMLSATEQLDASVSLFTNELLKFLQHEDPSVRRNVYLLLLLIVNRMREAFALDAELKFTLTRALYLASHDQDEECQKHAALLWSELRLKTSKSLCFTLIEDLRSPSAFIRHSAAAALKDILKDFEGEFEAVLNSLGENYKELSKARIQPAIIDDVGRKVRDAFDPWEPRSGVAEGMLQLSERVPSSLTMSVIKIVVPEGISDRNELCRDLMRQAACNVLKNHGEESMGTLLPYLEDILDNAPDGAAYDNLRQGLVVLMGTLARHLDPSHDKLRQIFARLIEALSTNAEQVQQSVADCLPALVPVLRDESRALVPKLVVLLSTTEDYGERRGAAFGIAALVHGLGIVVMKDLELAATIKRMLSNKQNVKHRQGALFCFEMLCSIVGKAFEPYVVQLLPDLLNCFGDSSPDVRAAAEKTANAMMKSLSQFGVKLVLPPLLKALESDSWRTKEACAELLGAMSNCAPQQLSACLPQVVPRLCEVMADSQMKVSKAGERAMKQIANVIRNPEVMAIKSHLEAALRDPAGKTTSCLQTIVNTRFVHHVDSPSLALMMPIIKRALTERTEARKMAAHIIANIYKLVDHKDMEPYLADLMPGLKKALLDPVPEVRTVAAKAIGATVKYSSEQTSEKLQEDIIPWLRKNLVSATSVVDRSGAAQGLSEVIAAKGEEFLKESMPEVVRITESVHTEPYIRDGYILLFIYLPLVMEEKFIPFIPLIVPSILKALADENEYVRDSALRAGQRLIAMYCNQAKKLLLPQLQTAIIHESWRIRQAAVKLIGDFLFKISGISGKMTSDTAHDDDTLGIENVDKTLLRQLGQKSRDEIIAGLYLTRHDTSLLVRQASSHVWKVVVSNTPKTLKEVIKTLFDLIIFCLSSSSEDRKQMAARCLGELVRKMGERVLTEILPVLKAGLESDKAQQRHGVAMALNEIITNTHKDIILTHTDDLMEPIKKCICDPALHVKRAAAETFNSFYQSVGYIAMDEVVGPLLEEFNKTDDDNILDGLCAVMSSNSRQLLPALLPKLTKPPINSVALCRLAAAAGDHLSRHMPKVLESLLGESSLTDQQEHIENCLPVLLSVTDEEGVGVMVNTLLKRATQENHVTSAILLKELMANSRADLIEVFEPLCNGLLQLYNSPEAELVDNAIEAISLLIKRADAAAIVCVIPTFKKAAQTLRTSAKDALVPGLCNPKGWQPLLAILREGLLSGTVGAKETAAISFGLLLSVSNEDGVRPHAIGMAGPLIRVLGDRYPPAVKQAVLTAMIRLLDKAISSLKPFVPQMQSIFFKTLQESGPAAIRLSAGEALTRLIAIHPKPDAIASDILKAINSTEDPGIKESLITTLRSVVDTASATGQIKAETVEALESLTKNSK